MDQFERDPIEIEYEIPGTDSDPLAAFGHEPGETGAEPFTSVPAASPSLNSASPSLQSASSSLLTDSPPLQTAEPLPAYPADQNASTAFLPVNSTPMRTKWLAAGLVSGAFAAFAAGALVYVNYPKWSANTATGTTASATTGTTASATTGTTASAATATTASPATATTTIRGDGSQQLTAGRPAEEKKPAAVSADKTPSIDRQKTERPTARTGQTASSAVAGDVSRSSSAASRNSSVPDAPRTQAPPVEAADSDLGSLTGQWSINTRVESSSLRRYKGLRLQYQVRLQQVGNQITGEGYKLRENDRTVGTRTPITLIGDVIGDRVVLNFEERGTRRMSGGRLVLDRESENVLRGRFSSDAAKSSGVADVHR